MKYFFLLLVISTIINCCKPIIKLQSGYCISTSIFWDKTKQLYVTDTENTINEYIYKDSFVIFKRKKLVSITNSFLDTSLEYKTESIVTMYYVFANMNSSTYYEFDSLSKDSKCFRSYNKLNNILAQYGINFSEKSMAKFNPLIPDNALQKDTFVDGVKLRLFTDTKKYKSTDTNGITLIDKHYTTLRWYLRDGLFNKPLQLNHLVDEKYNSTLIRFEAQPDQNWNTKGTVIGGNYLKYTPKKLKHEEEEIIKVWAKYAKEHPIEY
jgi:hypothetical protein